MPTAETQPTKPKPTALSERQTARAEATTHAARLLASNPGPLSRSAGRAAEIEALAEYIVTGQRQFSDDATEDAAPEGATTP